jgi:hypothetical protein
MGYDKQKLDELKKDKKVQEVLNQQKENTTSIIRSIAEFFGIAVIAFVFIIIFFEDKLTIFSNVFTLQERADAQLAAGTYNNLRWLFGLGNNAVAGFKGWFWPITLVNTILVLAITFGLVYISQVVVKDIIRLFKNVFRVGAKAIKDVVVSTGEAITEDIKPKKNEVVNASSGGDPTVNEVKSKKSKTKKVVTETVIVDDDLKAISDQLNAAFNGENIDLDKALTDPNYDIFGEKK